MPDFRELKLQADAIGYRLRVVDQLQWSQDGRLVAMFCLAGGGPHENPVVSEDRDFCYFEVSEDGLRKASVWLAGREGEMKGYPTSYPGRIIHERDWE